MFERRHPHHLTNGTAIGGCPMCLRSALYVAVGRLTSWGTWVGVVFQPSICKTCLLADITAVLLCSLCRCPQHRTPSDCPDATSFRICGARLGLLNYSLFFFNLVCFMINFGALWNSQGVWCLWHGVSGLVVHLKAFWAGPTGTPPSQLPISHS